MITVKEAGRKPYPAYKDTDIPWLDELPEHWARVRVQDLGSGKAKSFTDGDWIESPYITSDGTRLIQTGNIGVGKFIEKGYRYVSNTTFEELHCTEVEPGDILICRLGEPVARACAAPDLGKRMITSVDVCIVKVRDDLNPQFAIYSMSSGSYLDWVGSTVRGSTRDRISRFMLGKFVLPLPPPDEQTAIVRYLDDADQRIRAYVSVKERLISLLEEERQAVIHQAVTKGLDPNVKLKSAGVEWLGDVPGHWEIRPLKRWVSTKITDGPHETPDLLDDGIPFMSAESMVGGRLDFSRRRGLISREQHELYCRKCRPQINDIFMCKSGATTGKVAIVDTADEFSVWSPLALIRVDPQKVLAHLLFAVLQDSYIQQQVEDRWSYGTQPNLAMNTMERIAVMLPPIAEQRELLAYLGRATKKTSEAISRAHRQIDLFQEYRIRLIADVVAGKLDVREAAAQLPAARSN